MSEIRLRKIESLLQEEISKLILHKVIKDHRVTTLLSVTEVKVSKDLSYAKVYVSSFQKKESVDEAVKALNHAVGFIQGHLGKKLHMRTTPKLTFYPDSAIEYGVRMTRIIEDLNT